MGHWDKQERIVFSVKLQAELWNGHCQQRPNRIEKMRILSQHHQSDPECDTSDEELMDCATGKMVGTGGSAVSSMFAQLLTSAETEKVQGALVRGVGSVVRC